MKLGVFASVVGTASALLFQAPFDTGKDWKVNVDKFVTEGKQLRLARELGKHGSVWTAEKVPFDEWTLEAVIWSHADSKTDVKDSGFALWFVDKPLEDGNVHGCTDSWDGLAVMVDSLVKDKAGNPIGSVRGHLNDGTTKFSQLTNVEQQSMSLCQLPYRNAAGAITVRIGYSRDGFVVDVNGQKCFISRELQLPAGYFGISANSNGDMLSIDRLEVSPGVKADLYAHLPALAINDALKDPLKDSPSQKGSNPNRDGGYPNRDSFASPSDEKDLNEILRPLLKPALQKIELMDVKLGQVESVIDQLVNTLTISLNQVSKGSNGASDSQAADVLREIRSVQAQVNDWRKSTAVQAGQGAQKLSFGETLLLACLLPVPTVFTLIIYNSWRQRRRSHEKLL